MSSSSGYGQFGSELFPESPATEGDVAMQEQVERLLERRIDLNRASTLELLAIPWLNSFLAYRIVAARDSVGRFESVEQLRRVPGMTEGTFEALRPFLRIGSRRQAWTGSVVSRAGSDSVQSGAVGLRTFDRLNLQLGQARVSALAEKDRGETSAFDFLSAGTELRLGRARVTLGDFTAGFGRGLVFSAPYWRSSFLDGAGRTEQNTRLVNSAVEDSYLRGGAVEATVGRWNVCVLGSYAGRDARLNEDGTVERLVGSGVHDDSAALAGRNAVREASGGFGAGYHGSTAGAGFAAGYSRYSRTFAPADSGNSFIGGELFAAGVNAEFKLVHYDLGVEMAGSSGSGLAGAVELNGDWPDFDVRVSLRGRQARFFAPHGRWSSLTETADRLDASGRLAWRHGGSGVSVSGNTYRDFAFDSVPAKLDLRLGQELGGLNVALTLGARYRAELERQRTARVELRARISHATTTQLILADVYPEKSESRGVMAALLLTQGLGRAELDLAAARLVISGPGVTMYLHEPGAERIGSSYSTGVSAWRLSAGCGVRIGEWLRLGLKAGCAWKPQATMDGAAQLELEKR
ncbi:MAG: helix-hairpin-helix domain-containing protein [candidate division WOR-3 bacterium]|nr:helix-hairpin-helix domain-containing protein [candidate division WOR-3 bacterium]